MKVYRTFILCIGIMLLMVFSTAGCLTLTVDLQKNKYVPGFNADEFKEYQGMSIYMPSFENRADNTTIWYFYSQDKKKRYQSDNLERFFWNCFQDCFLHAGMFVYENVHPLKTSHEERLKEGLKEFRLQFSSLTDTEFRFIITMFDKGNIIFQRKFIIPMQPVDTKDRTELEGRIFKMVDKTFVTILKDARFRGAFFADHNEKKKL